MMYSQLGSHQYTLLLQQGRYIIVYNNNYYYTILFFINNAKFNRLYRFKKKNLISM